MTRSPPRSARSRPTSAWSSPSISSRRSSPPAATRQSAPPSPRRSSPLADDPDQRVVVVLAIRADFYGRCADYRALSAQISANTGARRADEPRGAAPRDRAPRPQRPGCGSSRRSSRRWSATSPTSPAGCRCSPPPWSSCGRSEAGAPCARRATRRAAASAARWRGSPSAPTGASAEPQRERARAILLRLADAEEAAPVQKAGPARRARGRARRGRGRRARGADREPAGDGRRGHGRGRPRGAASRVAAPARLARGGRRGPAPSPAPDPRRRASGRAPGAIRRSSTAAPGSPRRSTGRPSHERELNELERAFLDESRAASEREAERQRRTNRRLRALLAGVGVLLAAAVVAGVIALSERQGARSAATVADAQRLGAQALTEERLDRALPLAGAGVALDDSVATRSSLLSTLVRGPRGARRPERRRRAALRARAQPRRTHARDRRRGRHRDPLRHRDAGANRRATRRPDVVTWLGFHPRDGSLAIVGGAGAKDAAYLHVIDAATQRPRSSVSLGRHPADPGLGLHPHGNLRPGRTERDRGLLSG